MVTLGTTFGEEFSKDTLGSWYSFLQKRLSRYKHDIFPRINYCPPNSMLFNLNLQTSNIVFKLNSTQFANAMPKPQFPFREN